MFLDVNEFFTITCSKQGVVRVAQDSLQEDKLFLFLRDMEYRVTRLDAKRTYYQRVNNEVVPVSISTIERELYQFLKSAELINVPECASRDDILSWFFTKRPIKNNGLLDYYLEEPLTAREIHQLKLKVDPTYRYTYEIQQLLSKLQEWDFKKTVDVAGNFCKDNNLYYKNIREKKYLVFNHFCQGQKLHGGFDAWIAVFTRKKEIGRQEAEDISVLKLNFHLDEDFSLIRPFATI